MSDADSLDPVLLTAMAQLLHLRTRLGASRALLERLPAAACDPSDLCFLRSAPACTTGSPDPVEHELVAVFRPVQPPATGGAAAAN
jgi:hypothetical protein